ncbi:MAG: TldD/PmbA family protein, partial [Planctomycetota bacterium]|nr:TldD/PmbA family protein [Planctomycetota bacterium]
MKDLCQLALDTARLKGATYADIRIVLIRNQEIVVRNGNVSALEGNESLGFGVRVIANGAWGFASCSRLTREDIERTSAAAVALALAGARLKTDDVRLTPEAVHVDTWQTPYVVDPFTVSLEKKVGLLLDIDKVLRKSDKIAVAQGTMSFIAEDQWLATSEGTFIHQNLMRSGAGYSATAVAPGESHTRSYPSNFGGQCACLGYEIIPALGLLENAERVREEAVALLTAPMCPSGKLDLVLEGSQLGLQIHESCGHPTELDRVFGTEESYAGRSFLTPEKYKKLKYGSDIVNLVADSTVPTGLGTIGYDDDGVRAQRWHIVKNGMFVGYQTNREFAARLGEPHSMGNCRADGWSNLPMIRITNLSLMPGDAEFDDLIGGIDNGVYMATNKTWSIDQLRYNFQFSCEIGWEIKNGKLGRMVKHPTYQGITPEFWNSCDAICKEKYWTLWGVPNCGKGQPGQRAEMSHGA